MNKILVAAMAAGLLGVATTSCDKDFLDEELITGKSTDYFKTQKGLDELSIGLYQKLKFKVNYTWGYFAFNAGTDEFSEGNNRDANFNAYGVGLNPSQGDLKTFWDNFYGTIEPANRLLSYTPGVYEEGSKMYNTRMGEGYFMRAYAYFELVKLFGGVPINTEPTTGARTEYSRNTAEEVYELIISDLEKAYNLLPAPGDIEAFGRISNKAAAHYLAKAHLYRASEINADWNAKYKSEDLAEVIAYGDEVIAAHPLCNDFVELWDYKEADGANERVSEVILSAQFSNDMTTWGRFGNQTHLAFPSVYQNMAGLKRDISGDREFCYLSTTNYTIDVFDRVNDSRFWKSFITTYGCNFTDGAPTWGKADVKAVEEGVAKYDGTIKEGDKRFVGGQLGLKYIVNSAGDTRYTPYATGKEGDEDYKSYKVDVNSPTVLRNDTLQKEFVFVRYYKDQPHTWATKPLTADKDKQGNFQTVINHARFIALSKFRDGYRESIASPFGTRDFILARSAEDVLMVAEAYARKGDNANAIKYLNMLRERAGYSEGEDRSKHVDGGQAYKNNSYCNGKGGGFSADGAIYHEVNTYFESNNMERTSAETKSAMKLNSIDDIKNSPSDKMVFDELGISSDEEIMLNFILNEYTREMCGEYCRWDNLSRTKTTEARWSHFNDGADLYGTKFDPAKHYLRPIPQSFLDGITKGGSPLSESQKQAMQNPGY